MVDGKIAAPRLPEVEAAIFYVFIKLVIVFAVADEIVGWAVESHKGVELWPLESRYLFDEGAIEAVVDVFVLFFFDEAAL